MDMVQIVREREDEGVKSQGMSGVNYKGSEIRFPFHFSSATTPFTSKTENTKDPISKALPSHVGP